MRESVTALALSDPTTTKRLLVVVVVIDRSLGMLAYW